MVGIAEEPPRQQALIPQKMRSPSGLERRLGSGCVGFLGFHGGCGEEDVHRRVGVFAPPNFDFLELLAGM
jgi:hypothetical protein